MNYNESILIFNNIIGLMKFLDVIEHDISQSEETDIRLPDWDEIKFDDISF